jgi:predicted dehydrogenase
VSRTSFRLGLVGCGRLAELGYLPAVRALGDVQLVAVADPDTGRARHVADLVAGAAGSRPAIHVDAAALVAAAELDGVVLASPAFAHLDDAAAAAAHGVPTLVEKPPAPDLAGTRALAALDPAPWVGFNRRFDAGAAAARGRVPRSGLLNLDVAIAYRRQSWGAVVVHDDVLSDLGPHLVDWVRWFSGDEVVAARSLRVTQDLAEAVLVLRAGGRAVVRAAADHLHEEHVEVRDVNGVRLARHRVGGPVGAVLGRVKPGPHPLAASLAAQLEAFVAATRGVAPPDLGTAADGVAAMAVIDAVRTSSQHGGALTPVPPTDDSPRSP